MLNLDTHILIHALEGNLSLREEKALSVESWSISAIVLWELSKLIELERIEMSLESPETVRSLSRIHVWPLTLEICREIGALDFDSDPADEIIAATSVVHRVPLVTRDRTLLKSKKTPLAKI
ncbi:MAG: PIN domain-containing protein [Deltaproteobacteria bacterium]|nr:PIN domain-containing protein [Deltaproteobacteria bacterium]MBI3293366.1 PIN domain-containing protein [Deltaproteobacteria bacterium]